MSFSKGSSFLCSNSESTSETFSSSGGYATRTSVLQEDGTTHRQMNISTLDNDVALQITPPGMPVLEPEQGRSIGISISAITTRRPSSKKPRREWAQRWEMECFEREQGFTFAGYGFVGSGSLVSTNSPQPITTGQDLDQGSHQPENFRRECVNVSDEQDDSFEDAEIIRIVTEGKHELSNRILSLITEVKDFRRRPDDDSSTQTQSSSSDGDFGNGAIPFKIEITERPRKRKRSEKNAEIAIDEEQRVKLKKRRSRFGQSVEVGTDLPDANSINVSLDEVVATRNTGAILHSRFHTPLPLSKDSFVTDLRQRIQWNRTNRNRGQIPLVIIDGSNVGYRYGETVGGEKRLFSCRGIMVCVNHFLDLGCPEVYVVLPRAKLYDETVQDAHILHDLNTQGRLWTTWSRQLDDGKWISSYDDKTILDLATNKDGVVISNDKYRDLWEKNVKWRYVIENKVFQFRFDVGKPHEIYFPLDPLGFHVPLPFERESA